MSADGDAQGDAPDDPVVSSLIAAHNRERAEEGLPPLTPNPILQAAAEAHARDMAEHHKMSHKGTDGSTPEARIEHAGYAVQSAGENVAEGQTSVAEAMQSWMNSPPHRRNILGKFTEIGAARATDSDGTVYWCVDFGRPWPKLKQGDAAGGLVKAINRQRAEAGLEPLQENEDLSRAAQEEARRMADQQTLKPRESGGASPFERAQKAGVPMRSASESLASGLAKPDDVVNDWMSRSSQKQSLLGNFSQVGVGYATAQDGTPYWCVLFVRP